MMRKHRLILSLALMASVTVFTGCKEDEVEKPVENSERLDALRSELLSLRKDYLNITDELYGEKLDKDDLMAEIEALRKGYDIDYAVLVTDFQGTPLAGAVVNTVIDGTVAEATTNEAGLATFTGLKRGDIAGNVSIEGFTSASYTSHISSSDDDYSATTRIPLFPKSGTIAENGLFTVKGKLYFDANDKDDTLNTATVAAGPNVGSPSTQYTQVKKADEIEVKAFLTLYSNPSGIDNSSSYGAVYTIAYDDAVFTATWNDDNTYSLKLPSRSVYNQLFDFTLTFEGFIKDKTLVNGSGETYTESRIFSLSSLYVQSEAIAGTTVVKSHFYSDSQN